ncbi:hypothetical protein N2603_23280 [Bradyrhizobium huanghuaihaiense]|uniref:hypothetical protein n=1 Tax=Bradyrhizobium huanghuaihaiense TaxID=990078 RepID=UPI0021AAC153|nr:hypothetical protein [Bradyrhizobium sp. CB3035]UWU73032.1 hypothetical protein N2603_23280 [Bradyrhizobium sp. CB3035]
MNMVVSTAAVVGASIVPEPAAPLLLSDNPDAVDAEASAGEPEVRMTLAELRRGPLVHEGPFPEYPPEIFGKLPEGFVLEEQLIEILCFWHRKSIEVVDSMSLSGAADDEEEFAAACAIKNRILQAALSARATRSSEVAAQLGAVVAEIDCLGAGVGIDEVLDVDHIQKLSAELSEATSPIVPKKPVGALQEGNKLTRAGLLARYQSFLVQELETVSWHLYGERDYAKHCVMFDDAVNARCRSPDYPLFDERGLPERARAVLESLKIDTETADA